MEDVLYGRCRCKGGTGGKGGLDDTDEGVLRRNVPAGCSRHLRRCLHAARIHCAVCKVRNGATLAESAHLCSVITTPDNTGLAAQRFFATRAKEIPRVADITL
jgi:hypothetical protein